MVIDDSTRIRVIIALAGMDCRTFAKTMGVSAGTVTSWTKGRCTPQRKKRKELAAFCQKKGIAFLPSGCPVPASDLLTSQETA
jgi:DNA-binding transcriptional regulator YiaG